MTFQNCTFCGFLSSVQHPFQSMIFQNSVKIIIYPQKNFYLYLLKCLPRENIRIKFQIQNPSKNESLKGLRPAVLLVISAAVVFFPKHFHKKNRAKWQNNRQRLWQNFCRSFINLLKALTMIGSLFHARWIFILYVFLFE